MTYETNRFCWHGVLSTDVDKAKAFYAETIGWKVEDMEMGGEKATMFVAGGKPLAHLMEPPMPGVPSHWQNYLRVDDVDKTVKEVERAGGKVIAPAIDIPPGRFAVVTTPSGAAFSVYHEADEAQATHHPGGEGGIHWTELHSQDIDKDLAFLEKVFGFQVNSQDMPGGMKYHILQHGGKDRGGAMQAMSKDVPSNWMSWVHVGDVDAALERVKRNGGQAFTDGMEMEGIGRMAAVADNTGGTFGIITPAST
jgi:hypothetical protein